MRPFFLFSFVLLAACNGRVLDVGSSGPQRPGGSSGSGAPFTGPGAGSGTSGGSSGPQAGIAGGSGYFTVMSDVSGSAYAASVVFTSDFIDASSITSVGPCQIYPTYLDPVNDHSGVVGAPRPQAGDVRVDGSGLALVFHPDASGDYAPQNGALPGWKGGEAITFAWPGPGASSGLEAGLSQTFRTPVYASLDPTSALGTKTSNIPLLDDLTLLWHTDSPPAADDKIVLDLRVGAGGDVFRRAVCAFDASAGKGVVPANVIANVGRGTGTYAVTSEHAFSTVLGYEWHLNYTLAAYVRDATDKAVSTVHIGD